MSDQQPRAYEQMTLTERAEAHILAARQLLGGAQQNMVAANNQLPGPAGQALAIAAAEAMWTGAQAEAQLAQACAMLAANEGRETDFQRGLLSAKS